MDITERDNDLAMSDMIPAHIEHLRVSASPLTVRDRRRVLLRLHRDLPNGLAFASTSELERWLGQPGRDGHGWSQSTRATYAMHIREFYRWATEVGWDGWTLDGNPSLRMRRPRPPHLVPQPITDAQLARALGSDEPWRTACLLAAFAGLRCGEIARAERQHLTETTLYVPLGKGGDGAAVPMHPDLWTALRGRPAGRLVTNGGAPVDGPWVSQRGRAMFVRTGQTGVRMHRLRHWYATTLLELGADLPTVQQCMRHASITSTVGYTQITGQRRRDAVGRLPFPGTQGAAPAA